MRRGRWIGEAETEGLNFGVKMGLKGQFYDDNSFILFAVRPTKEGGREQGVQGGRIRPPAHRRASKASLEPERLAKPISRAEH